MYKYTHVLFFLAYFQGVFCWNSFRVPNSISDLELFHETNPSYDDSSDPDTWAYGHNKKSQFSDEASANDYSGRITFPDDKKDYPNNGNEEKDKHSQRFILKCIRSCPLQNEYKPVCGSDDITYYNLDLLRCVRGCGDDVELRYPIPCNDLAERSTQPPINTGVDVESCLSTCPTTPEYNPVCGTDNVTYKNIGKLNCAQTCGADVELKRRLPCPKETVDDLLTTEGPLETTTINSRYFQACIDSCPTTSEYKPVCASNGKTYFNTGKFQCAKNCGLNISMRGLGVCQVSLSGESDILSSTTSTTNMPEIPNKQPVTTLQSLLDKIFSSEDTGDPKLDVRHS